MALKSIIDLELNDSAWVKFQAQYKTYETALANSPTAWNAVNKSIDGSRESFDKLVGAASARLVQAKLTAEAEKVASDQLKRQSGEATSQARSWSSMAKDSKAFAGNVINATKSLIQWAGVTTAVSGILGAGGLFGIDRLAQSAAGQRKDASGIRVTPGELRSFDLNFNRLLNNPTGFLTGVSESLSDVTKAAPYGALGLNYARERQKTPADVAIDVLRAEKSLADRTPQNQLGNTFASRQLGMLGQSVEDFQRIKDRPLAELEEYIKSNQRDKGALNLDRGQLKAWEDFKVQLGRAGDSIEKTFIVALTPLAPQLGKLSTSVTGLVDAFLRNPNTAKWLDEAAAGIGNFADYIGTPKFKEDVQGLASGISFAAGKIVSGLRLLGLIPDALIPGGNDDKTRDSGGLGGLSLGSPLWNNTPESEQGNYVRSPRTQRSAPWLTDGRSFGAIQAVPLTLGQQQTNARDMSDALLKQGYTREGVAALLGSGVIESGLNPRAIQGGGAHSGIFQWDQPRQAAIMRQFGKPVSSMTPTEQAAAAAWELNNNPRFADLNRQLKDSHDLAANNSGVTKTFEAPGNYDTEIPNRLATAMGVLKTLRSAGSAGQAPPSLEGHVPPGWGAGHLNDTGHAKWPAAMMATAAGRAAAAIAEASDRAATAAGHEKYHLDNGGSLPYAHKMPDRSVQIQIHNNTGGNTNVTLSQLST